jgi:uncharacterized protein with NRDE domain
VCVLAFAWRAHPRWLLVAAGNRDEYHDREAAPLAEWDDRPGVIAGRDLRSGGTWMGVSRGGRFAVVTNVRGGTPAPAPRSRGELVTDALLGGVPHRAEEYGAYNLVVADRDAATFSTNRPAPAAHPLAPGVHGLANAGLDEPWPKTVRLKAILSDWLAGPADAPELLLPGLAEEAPDDPALSGIFIRNPVYGTRCSTVVAVDADGAGAIVERRFTPAGDPSGETQIAFDWR